MKRRQRADCVLQMVGVRCDRRTRSTNSMVDKTGITDNLTQPWHKNAYARRRCAFCVCHMHKAHSYAHPWS